jgi:hypothetical protein
LSRIGRATGAGVEAASDREEPDITLDRAGQAIIDGPAGRVPTDGG